MNNVYVFTIFLKYVLHTMRGGNFKLNIILLYNIIIILILIQYKYYNLNNMAEHF